MSGYLVTSIYRAHSSGWGDRIERMFTSLGKASNYLLSIYDGYIKDYNYPEEWDQEDMFTDEKMTTPAPPPTAEMGATLFSVQSLHKFFETKKKYSDDIIYGPWSDYECQIPFEITIKQVEID